MYSTIVKILFLNSMLGGFPLYLLEKLFSHLVISVAWNGTKYVIKGIGNYIFSEPIEINLSNNLNKVNNKKINENNLNNLNNKNNLNTKNNRNESREQQESILEKSILNIQYEN